MEPFSKARIKLIQSLQHKKYRQKYDKFIAEGLKITRDLLLAGHPVVEMIYCSNPDYLPLLEEIAGPDRIHQITPSQMRQISQMSTPPGVLAICMLPEEDHLPETIDGLRMFYLDAIRDPGNLGTILRIADWFGLDFVLLSPDCVDIFNPKVLQASMGSVFRVKTCVLDKVGLLAISNGKIYVCDTGGKSINTFDPPADGIFVFGNESLGVSGDIMHQVKEVISIPGDRSLGAESLNVASAAAIVGSWLSKEQGA